SIDPPHADCPSQLMSQRAEPQVSVPPHELAWLQAIVHALAAEQSTPLPHADLPQVTSQGMPGGHTGRVPHAESAVQSKMHLPLSQRLHTAGHTNASADGASIGAPSATRPPSPTLAGSTQKFDAHTRPPSHSLVLMQVKSGERRSKVHAESSRSTTYAILMAS